MFGRIAGPVYHGATRRGVALELFEVSVEVRKGMFLYPGGQFAQLFPFRHGRSHTVALYTGVPQIFVMHALMHVIAVYKLFRVAYHVCFFLCHSYRSLKGPPLSTWAMCINGIWVMPSRRAIPCWCIRHDISGETTYWAP